MPKSHSRLLSEASCARAMVSMSTIQEWLIGGWAVPVHSFSRAERRAGRRSKPGAEWYRALKSGTQVEGPG